MCKNWKKKKRQVSKSFQKRFFATILLFFFHFFFEICEQSKEMDAFFERKKKQTNVKFLIEKKKEEKQKCIKKSFVEWFAFSFFFFFFEIWQGYAMNKKTFCYLFRILVSKRKRGSQKLSFELKSKPKFFSSSKKKTNELVVWFVCATSNTRELKTCLCSKVEKKELLKKKIGKLKIDFVCVFLLLFEALSIQSVFFRFRKLCLVCCFFFGVVSESKKKKWLWHLTCAPKKI